MIFCLLGLYSLPSIAIPSAQYAKNNTTQVKAAINKYKIKNYVGCIQDMTLVVKKDPSNVVAYYYMGSAYMKIGDKNKAIAQFDKVIALNSVPSLTSYAIQAKSCMNGTDKCEYIKLNDDQVQELVKDPENYLGKVKAERQSGMTPDNVEIERLIKGRYNSSIHPQANRIIIDTLLKQEKHDMNVNAEKFKSEASDENRIASAENPKLEGPTNDEIANAVKVLARAGINPIQQSPMISPYGNFGQNNNEYAYLSSMLGNNQNNQQNNFMNMLPFLVQQNGNQRVNSEMVQAMMMSQMMPDFNFSNNDKN